MTACVACFPIALTRVGDLSRAAFLRRVRLTALARGCNRANAAAIEREAIKLLDQGDAPRQVFARCEHMAQQRAEPQS